MNRPKEYRNMDLWRKTKNQSKMRYYRQFQKYPPRKWTANEDKLILEHNSSDRELSELLERSVGAIQYRRCLLNKRREKKKDGE